MIQLTDVVYPLFIYKLYINSTIFDYNKRLIILSVIPLSGGHCIWNRVQQVSHGHFFLVMLQICWFVELSNLVVKYPGRGEPNNA